MLLSESTTCGALVEGVMNGKILSNYKADFKIGVLQSWANSLEKGNINLLNTDIFTDDPQKSYRKTHITKKTKVAPPSAEAVFYDVIVEEKVSFIILFYN